jgi:hypothetical protein
MSVSSGLDDVSNFCSGLSPLDYATAIVDAQKNQQIRSKCHPSATKHYSKTHQYYSVAIVKFAILFVNKLLPGKKKPPLRAASAVRKEAYLAAAAM